ncbi:hypothetical protein ES705_24565 [subsurface metagenome]
MFANKRDEIKFKKDKVTDKVTNKVTDKVTDSLSDNQTLVIKLLQQNRNITTKELSDIVKISQRKIKENIGKLKEKGLLKRIGPAKGGYWEALK